MTVSFVVLNEMMTGVIASQVIAPARCYASALPDITFRIIFLEPARVAVRSATRRRFRQLRKLWPEGRMTLLPYVGRLGRFAPALSVRAALFAEGRMRQPEVFHCRGPEATVQAARVALSRKARVVFDARGATDHETALRLTAQGRHEPSLVQRSVEYCLALEQEALAASDAVVAVGEVLAERYRTWSGGDRKPIGVVPCCVDRPHGWSPRETMRTRLGIGDDLLLVHTSTAPQWESFDDVVALFRAVRRFRRARLLFLTPLAAELVTRSMPPDDPLRTDVLVISAEPREVPAYLAAADVGLLLRRPHESFRMGTPIKFAEYLGAGLAIVVSPGIGNTADIVERRRLGVVLTSENGPAMLETASGQLLDLLQQQGPALRQRAIETCEQDYTWHRYIPQITRLYGVPPLAGATDQTAPVAMV